MAPVNPKPPPHDAKAERRILASMLGIEEHIAIVRRHLTPESFYVPLHAAIYETICGMHDEGEGVDMHTVWLRMRDAGKLTGPHGATSLADIIIDSPAFLRNLHTYIKIVREQQLLRLLDRMGQEIAQDARDGKLKAKEMALAAIDQLSEAVIDENDRRVESLGEVLPRSLDQIEQLRTSETGGGIPTGFQDLDRLTAGWQGGQFIVVGARPSVGKTALAIHFALAAAKHGRHPVIFSLEMTNEQLVNRIIAQEARMDLGKLRTGDLTEAEMKDLRKRAEQIAGMDVLFDDNMGASVAHIRTQARRLLARERLDMLIVDYLQLMTAPRQRASMNREQEVAAMSRGLKRLAMEMNVPVIALSQLSRKTEDGGRDRRPVISSLRESGAIEQDADKIILLYRPADSTPEVEIQGKKYSSEGLIELIVAKQRNGPIGSVWMEWDAPTTRFIPLDVTHLQPPPPSGSLLEDDYFDADVQQRGNHPARKRQDGPGGANDNWGY